MVYNVAAAFFAAHELGVDAAHLQPTLGLRARRRTHGRWDIAGRTVEQPGQESVGFDRQISPLKRQVAGSAPSSKR